MQPGHCNRAARQALCTELCTARRSPQMLPPLPSGRSAAACSRRPLLGASDTTPGPRCCSSRTSETHGHGFQLKDLHTRMQHTAPAAMRVGSAPCTRRRQPPPPTVVLLSIRPPNQTRAGIERRSRRWGPAWRGRASSWTEWGPLRTECTLAAAPAARSTCSMTRPRWRRSWRASRGARAMATGGF